MKNKYYILISILFCLSLQTYSQEKKYDSLIPVEIEGISKDTILHVAGSYWYYFQGKDCEAKKYIKDHPNEYKSTNKDPNIFVSEKWENYRIPPEQIDSIRLIIYRSLPQQIVTNLPNIKERIIFMALIKENGKIICYSFMCSSKLISLLGSNTIYAIVNALNESAKVVEPAEYDLNHTTYTFPIIIPNLYFLRDKK